MSTCIGEEPWSTILIIQFAEIKEMIDFLYNRSLELLVEYDDLGDGSEFGEL